MMRGRALIVVALGIALVAAPGVAHADADHDAKQDKQVANAKPGPKHDLGGGPQKRGRKGWGSDGKEATGYAMTLEMPLPPHAIINTFELHVRWTVRNHRIVTYSVWPAEGPGFPWTHWQYEGITSHVINTYPSRVYARFTADYRLCISWLVPACIDKHPMIHITVYGANKAPDEGGKWL